jgi:hypothetical protein
MCAFLRHVLGDVPYGTVMRPIRWRAWRARASGNRALRWSCLRSTNPGVAILIWVAVRRSQPGHERCVCDGCPYQSTAHDAAPQPIKPLPLLHHHLLLHQRHTSCDGLVALKLDGKLDALALPLALHLKMHHAAPIAQNGLGSLLSRRHLLPVHLEEDIPDLYTAAQLGSARVSRSLLAIYRALLRVMQGSFAHLSRRPIHHLLHDQPVGRLREDRAARALLGLVG